VEALVLDLLQQEGPGREKRGPKAAPSVKPKWRCNWHGTTSYTDWQGLKCARSLRNMPGGRAITSTVVIDAAHDRLAVLGINYFAIAFGAQTERGIY